MEATLILFLFSFLAFTTALVVLLLRWWSYRPWSCCTCDVCSAYMTSSWSSDYDNLGDWYVHLLRQSPTKTIHIHVLGNTITANPDNVEHMLKTRFSNYPKGKTFSSILGDLLGRGIFNVDGEQWRFQRKMASLELGSVSVRSYAFQIVTQQVFHRLLPLFQSVVDGGEVVDLQDVFRRFSFDTICKISFGVDPRCLDLSMPVPDFAKAFDTASRLSAKRATAVLPWVWKLKRLLNWGSERELRKAISLVSLLAEELIKQRRNTGFSTKHDLLSRFMGSVDDDQYLRDIVISFLLAGRDTVASGLTTFFLLLSAHPHVETAILQEISAAIDEEKAPTYDQLRGLHYVQAALYESMRLYPPVQFDSKFSIKDDVLPDGTFVKKGTRVTYHPYAMGRMEDMWGSDCMNFKPERWLDDGGTFVPASPFKYPVFQAGMRVCLGKELAVMEMKSVVVSIVRKYKVDVLLDRSPKFAPGLTATIKVGLPARIYRRMSQSS